MEKGRKGILRFGILGAIMLALMLILFKYTHTATTNGNIELGVIEVPDTINEYNDIRGGINDKVEAGMFKIFMNTDVKINEENEADLLIQNDKENGYSTFVEIYTGNNLIYKSGILRPGYKLEEDKIDSELITEENEYKAYFNILDNNDKVINRTGLNIDITKGE